MLEDSMLLGVDGVLLPEPVGFVEVLLELDMLIGDCCC